MSRSDHDTEREAPRREDEPAAWIIRCADGYESEAHSDSGDAEETLAAWSADPHMDQPCVLVPLYDHPAPPSCTGDGREADSDLLTQIVFPASQSQWNVGRVVSAILDAGFRRSGERDAEPAGTKEPGT